MTNYGYALQINPRTKILSILKQNHEKDTIENLLRIGFEKYKIFFNAVAVNYLKRNISSNTFENIFKICSFNPFHGGYSYFCKELDSENVVEALDELKNFMSQRLANLNGYPLKVIFIEYPISCPEIK